MRSARWFLILVATAGCAVAAGQQLDSRYGKPDPTRYERAVEGANADARADWQRAQDVFDRRCVVCHACYDAPCQLKLSSWDGLLRGGTTAKVYDLRVTAAKPTRLGIDEPDTAAWRARGFHPVLNEREAGPDADRRAGVLHRMLDLKRAHAPESGLLSEDRYDFSIDRPWVCPTIEDFDAFEAARPELGMPFALPPLTDAEYGTLSAWIRNGAAWAPPPPLPAAYREQVDAWEAFLNGDDLKSQLMARYLYEHWYLGHLWFRDLPRTEYFELVRSRTPPGEPIDLIATRRPYDDPKVERVYYRLRRMDETIVAKTHMPFALDAERMNRLRSWFLEADYEVSALPGYGKLEASNPFVSFRELPVTARYRTMLEEAQFTIMGFIKGPVCRGQVALNVINDHFWAVFADPDLPQAELGSDALAEALRELRVPAQDEDSIALLRWRKYSRTQAAYLKAKSEFVNASFRGDNAPKLSMLWDGDGTNRNAALTIYRHFDSATVLQGLVGERPQTAWVIGYSLLERIHYLLVAGYDVYGRLSHQLTTRMYMDFLRMEGESQMLAFLPLASRDAVRDRWYRGVGDDVKQYLQGDKSYFAVETGVAYHTDDPESEFYELLREHLAPVLDRRHELHTAGLDADVRAGLLRLASLGGKPVSRLPEMAFLTLERSNGTARHYTLMHNSAHTNISHLFEEEERRVPAEDTLSVLDGFAGAYPNAFYVVAAEELNSFVDAVASLDAEKDYAALMERWGVRRTDPGFWRHSDRLHAAYRQTAPLEAGVLDYNRYENR